MLLVKILTEIEILNDLADKRHELQVMSWWYLAWVLWNTENIWTKVEVTWHSGKTIQLHISTLIVGILRLEWAMFEKRLLECEKEVIMILIEFCGQRVGILNARFESRHTVSRCLYVIFYYFLYIIASFTESAQTKYIPWFHQVKRSWQGHT